MSIIKSYAAKEAGADLSLWEYDAGELQPEDVEVEVEYCGICHSDLSMIDNEWGMSSYPLVAGHEVIGRVAALGSAAQDKGLKIGQKVGIGWTARSTSGWITSPACLPITSSGSRWAITCSISC